MSSYHQVSGSFCHWPPRKMPWLPIRLAALPVDARWPGRVSGAALRLLQASRLLRRRSWVRRAGGRFNRRPFQQAVVSTSRLASQLFEPLPLLLLFHAPGQRHSLPLQRRSLCVHCLLLLLVELLLEARYLLLVERRPGAGTSYLGRPEAGS